MKETGRWVLLLPALCLLAGGWFLGRPENQARLQFERAREEWRLERFDRAINGFERLTAEFPRTSYAPRALWEIASIWYYNLAEAERATDAYRRLATSYPDSPLAVQSHLKQAELCEREFGDLEAARKHWLQAVEGELAVDQRRLVELKVADTYLYTSDLDSALARLQGLLFADDAVAQQARLRIGTILQIRKDHAGAAAIFRQVLRGPDCGPCRLQARLALIESYEVLDQLPSAIRQALLIDTRRYPADLKSGIISRLLAKQRSFRPRLFNAD